MAELPSNSKIAEQIDLLADLLELEGKDTFRVVAYRRAAARVRDTSGSIAQLALDGRAKELQGIGKTIEEKIVEIVEIGEIQALTKKKAGVPPEVVLFMKLPGLGPKTAARIWRELGVETLDQLKEAAESEPGARAEDSGAHLARARGRDARSAQGGCRVRAPADARRPRAEERGEDSRCAGVPGREPRDGPLPARSRSARGAGRRRGAP